MLLRYLISNTIYVVVFFWYNNKLFLKKNKEKHAVILLIALVVLKSFINLYTSFQLNLIVTIFTYLIISLTFFIGSLTKKFVFIGFYITTSFISEIIAFLILKLALPSYKIIIDSVIYSMMGSILSTVFLLIIIYIVTKVNDIRDMVDSKEFWYFITLPFTSIFIIYFIMHSNMLMINPNLCILITLSIIFFNIIICIGFSDIIKSRNIQIENERLKTQKLHYELLEEKFDNSRRFIHDFKKHINLINGYLNNDEFSELKSYLYELTEEIKNDEKFVITGNQVIDLALNSSKDLLSQYDIDIKHDIKIKDINPITAFDFNIVFSNILENSIESCVNCNGHFIKIKLELIDNLIILKVVNPCTQINENLKTMKNNIEYHGYGLKNIKTTVDKYNGSSSFEYDSDNHLFISTVIFNIL